MSNGRLLIISEIFGRGGLETHIESEIRTLSAMGWEVHLALSDLAPGARLPEGLKGVMTGLDLGPLATASQLLLTVNTLGRYIERNGITAVHCHPFTSCLAAFLAAGQRRIGLAFTLHGPASLSPFYGPVFELLFRRLILPHSGLVVCVSNEVATLARIAGTASATIALPNPVRLGGVAQRIRPESGPLRILCASRLDSEKVPGIVDFLTKLPRHLDWHVDVYGSGDAQAELDAYVEASDVSDRIALQGWSFDLASAVPSYDLVAGMGRVVIEAAVADVPAVLVGYDGVKGLLDRSNFESAAYSNFSGRGLATIDAAELAPQLLAAVEAEGGSSVRDLVAERHDENMVWGQFLDRLRAAVPADARSVDLFFEAVLEMEESDLALLQDRAFLDRLQGEGHSSGQAWAGLAGKARTMSAETVMNGQEQHIALATSEQIADIQRELDSLRSAVEPVEKLLRQEAEQAAKRLLKSQEELAKARSELSALAVEHATARAELVAEQRLVKRIEREAGQKQTELSALISQVAQNGAGVAGDERWRSFLEDVREQHRREKQTLEQFAEGRLGLITEQLALAENRLIDARSEIAALKQSMDVDLSHAKGEFLQARDEWFLQETQLRESLESAGKELAELKRLQGRAQSSAHVQIVCSIEAQVVALKEELRDLRLRAELMDAPHQPPSGEAQGLMGVTRGVRGLVSIVLPVYNQASLIAEAIEGVLQQTYSDWELIIIDDGSKDGLQDVLAGYTADRRIRLVRQPNQKLPSALNNGNFFARGEFMTWTSADNIMLPDQLAELVIALQANPQVGLAYSDYQAIDDRGAPLEDPDWRRHNRPDGSSMIRLPQEVTLQNFHVSGDNFLGASFMWRTDLQAVVGAYDESTFGGEDYDMWLRMHIVADFIHVPKILYKYRVHDNTLNARAKELDLFKNIKLLLDVNRERRESLLGDSGLSRSSGGFFRDTGQYGSKIRSSYDLLGYFELLSREAAEGLLDERVRVVVVDAPLRVIDLAVLAKADILVVPDDQTYFWLRQQQLPRHIRLLAGEVSQIRTALEHAIALASFDRTLARRGHVLAVKPYAQPIARIPESAILLLIQRWGVGGMEQVVIELAAGLAAKGARVGLGLVEGESDAHLRASAERAGFGIVELAGNPERLTAYCRQNNVGVAHFHHCGFGSRALSEIGVRTVYTFHNSYVWLDDAAREKHRELIAPMQSFIAVSREAASYHAKWFPISRPIFVVPNGSDIRGHAANAFAKNSSKMPDPRAEGRFGFLAVGTLTPHKLHDRLIRAFAGVSERFPEARLTIVGSASDQAMFQNLKELRRALPVPSACTLVPGVERAQVIDLMKSHHCFVLPSLIEGWSISLMEAVISGMVCIASDVGSARDMAQLTRSVVLVPSPAGDILSVDHDRMWSTIRSETPSFELTLMRAMIGVKERFAELDSDAQAAAEVAASAFSLDAMVEAHLDCYQLI